MRNTGTKISCSVRQKSPKKLTIFCTAILHGTSKVNRHTNRHTHIWTNQPIDSIGPECRCYENESWLHFYLYFLTKPVDMELKLIVAVIQAHKRGCMAWPTHAKHLRWALSYGSYCAGFFKADLGPSQIYGDSWT